MAVQLKANLVLAKSLVGGSDLPLETMTFKPREPRVTEMERRNSPKVTYSGQSGPLFFERFTKPSILLIVDEEKYNGQIFNMHVQLRVFCFVFPGY